MMTKGALVEILAALKYFWQVWLEEKLRNWLPDPDNTPETRPMNVEPVPAVLPTPAPTPEILKWDTPKQTWHSVRVMCDNSGLTFTQKNIVCACIWQESNFLNYLPNGEPVTHKNIKNGKVWSTDFSLPWIM